VNIRCVSLHDYKRIVWHSSINTFPSNTTSDTVSFISLSYSHFLFSPIIGQKVQPNFFGNTSIVTL